MKHLVQLLKILMLVATTATFVAAPVAMADSHGGDKTEEGKKKGGDDEEPECD